MVPDSHAASPKFYAKAIISRRRALLALPLFALWPARFSRSESSKERPDDIDVIREASELMVDWFRELRKATVPIADDRSRQRLKKALISLDHQLITLKIRASDFIDVLKLPTPAKEDIETSVRTFRGSVEDVRSAMIEVIPLLRKDYRDKGQKAASLLTTMIHGRKTFILSDDFNYDAVIADRSVYTSKSREAKEALKAAYETLEKLI
jgi:hypothetical protein